MTTTESERPFVPPLPRPPTQIWTATYKMHHRDLLAALEKAIESVPPDRAGYRWIYDGFGRKIITFVHSCYGAPPVTAEIKIKIEGDNITLFVKSNLEDEILLFRRLTAELDQQPTIAATRITPCTYQGVDPRPFAYLNY